MRKKINALTVIGVIVIGIIVCEITDENFPNWGAEIMRMVIEMVSWSRVLWSFFLLFGWGICN